MNDEILVHISAPATRQNDDLFRSLTEAYTIFVPHVRHGRESPHELHEPRISIASEGPLQSERTQTSYLSTSKDSYGSFPSLLSSGGQADSQVNNITGPGYASFRDGSNPTSSRLARLDHIQTRWKEQITPRPSFMDREPQGKRQIYTSEDAAAAFIEDTQLGAQTLQSQLHETYSTTSEDTSEDEPDQNALESVKIPSEQALKNIVCKNLEAPASEQPTTVAVFNKAPADRSNKLRLDLAADLKSSIAAACISHDPQNIASTSQVLPKDFSKLPIDAFPPAPKVSIERPSQLPSQITKHLAAIRAHNLERFQPTLKSDAPKSDNRGYWSVDCSQWSVELQHQFWTAACEHVLSGRLGWGTTLHREALSPQTLGLVRVYCWAEVVEHIWLLLWLCSKGQIANSGSKWMDAGGGVVYEVP